MSTSDVLKTYQNITDSTPNFIDLLHPQQNSPTQNCAIFELIIRKLEVEMVQYANDILEKRKCLETLRIASPVI